MSRQCNTGSRDVVNDHQLFYLEVTFPVHEAREKETLIATHYLRILHVSESVNSGIDKALGRSIHSPEDVWIEKRLWVLDPSDSLIVCV